MNANNISNSNTPNSNTPNSDHFNSGNYDTPPPIRNEYDVLSSALHQHGYWPDHSLIILTATEDTLGPSLRVNLPDEPCTLTERADFLHETFAKLPTCHNGETLTRFYTVIVDGDNTVRQRQLSPNTVQLAAIEEIQQDVDTQININTWLHLLHDPRIVSELRCEDIIYAGGASIWALDPRTTSAHPPRTHRRNPPQRLLHLAHPPRRHHRPQRPTQLRPQPLGHRPHRQPRNPPRLGKRRRTLGPHPHQHRTARRRPPHQRPRHLPPSPNRPLLLGRRHQRRRAPARHPPGR